eukprot:COSAG06_NODE_36827_length_442_cov_0.953353_2_plen_45_part_01
MIGCWTGAVEVTVEGSGEQFGNSALTTFALPLCLSSIQYNIGKTA